MKKLRCLQRYINEPMHLDLDPGDTLDVSDAIAQQLHNDAPGAFEDLPLTEEPVVQPGKREVAAPPRTTAIKHAPRTKGTSE